MLLSEIEIKDGILVSDAEFDILALSNTKQSYKILCFLENDNFLEEVNNNDAISCIICSPDLKSKISPKIKGIYICNNPRVEFFKLHNRLVASGECIRNIFKSHIGENTIINPRAYVSDKNVTVGSGCEIEEFVSIQGNVIIGNNVIIRAGSLIGGQGFEFKREYSDKVVSVNHVGGVIIGDNVEIQQGCTIHRAVYSWDDTIINCNTKFNAKVHIDHGVKIGERTLIGASATVCGRANIGKDCWIGPRSVISNRINIGNNAKVSLGSVVTKDVCAGEHVSGNFAINHMKFLQYIKNISK